MLGVRSLVALVSVVSLFSFVGCSKDPTKFEPSSRGKRGENCQARNDCQDGLACLNGICGINEFSVSVAVKHCDIIECSTTEDCCGDKPTEVPAKCSKRDATCLPSLAGCVANQVCTSDATCGAGTCRPAAATGTCSGGNLAGRTCASTTDCQDLCVNGACSYSLDTCTENIDCLYYSTLTTTCAKASRTCNCVNPEYLPSDPICTDPDCTDLCTLRCDKERCVVDRSCKKDTDCAAATPFCSDGQCVQCTADDDCADGQSCDSGVCHTPCKHNEECSAFYECNADSGECEYVGCKSDRECILAANAGNQNVSTPTPSGEDPRLLKCLPSEADPAHKTCKIPCENDGSCGAQSVCDAGFCKFIGCESSEECRAYLGLVNKLPTTAKPYVPTAICRE
ncbi:MAG TPA: hypothetical protein VFK05_01575 [Polyangiaceae bacterium]|nr:hypothetical protein [Polyangiaceae bacterium]